MGISGLGYIPSWPFGTINSHRRWWAFRHGACIPPVGLLSKLFLEFLCRSEVIHQERLMEALDNRPPGQGLITVCNHYSCLDDPMLHGMLTWRRLLLDPQRMRWSPGGHNILFTNSLYTWYFASGRSVPIVRGHGVYQQAMDFLIERLSLGEWVHLFPEGRVNMLRTATRLRWGVGRLVCEPSITPLVLPYFHQGMDAVLPNRRPYIPRPGRRVTVLVGRPLELTDAVSELRRSGATARRARETITQLVQDKLEELRVAVEPIHARRLSSGR